MTASHISSPSLFYFRHSQRRAATNYGLVGQLVPRSGLNPRPMLTSDCRLSVERIRSRSTRVKPFGNVCFSVASCVSLIRKQNAYLTLIDAEIGLPFWGFAKSNYFVTEFRPHVRKYLIVSFFLFPVWSHVIQNSK